MPNWVKNIVHIEGPADDITKALDLMRDKNIEGDIDFDNIIPMPKRLKLTAGGYDKQYVALYLKTLDVLERARLQDKLHNRKVSFYETYSRKYADSFTMAAGFMDIPEDKLNWMRQCLDRDYKDLLPATMEDIGKAYIDNILEYGADTWYDWCIDNWGTKWNACEATIGDDYLEFETAWDAALPVTAELSRRFPELIFCHEYADEDICRNLGVYHYKNGKEVFMREFESDEEAREFACMLWGYEPEDFEE